MSAHRKRWSRRLYSNAILPSVQHLLAEQQLARFIADVASNPIWAVTRCQYTAACQGSRTGYYLVECIYAYPKYLRKSRDVLWRVGKFNSEDRCREYLELLRLSDSRHSLSDSVLDIPIGFVRPPALS